MTREEALKILEVAVSHADAYRRGNTLEDQLSPDVAEKCATAASNTGWQILRTFGYSHEQIMELKAELDQGAPSAIPPSPDV